MKGGRRKVLDKNRKIGYNCENFTYLSRYFVVKVTSAGYILTVSEKSDTSEEVVMKILIVDDEEDRKSVV